MTIDTKIEGDPASIRASAAWLRDTLGNQLSTAVNDLDKVRGLAESGWDGESGDAFVTKTREAATKANTFLTEVQKYATALETLAGQVQQAQLDMSTVRTHATEAGLTLTGTTIEKPSDDDATKVAAYSTVSAEAEKVRDTEEFWGTTWNNMVNDVKDKWFLVIGDMINGAAGVMATRHASKLLQSASSASSLATALMDDARFAPVGSPREVVYRNMHFARDFSGTATALNEQASNAKTKSAKIGFRVGGALAIAGVVYDIHNGKPVEQAVVSGAAGFGASVAAGAATGAILGSFFPVVGNIGGAAVGTVVGAGAGLFTSGAVDALYQDGLSVGSAINGGIDAFEATGDAIGGGVSKAWNAIF
ncbi:hypothetical protein [Nocardia carnea]|uniref:hypothetical protein n=1 Tax=Nocardia carnea TaxID=37328 RepID=UPI00245493E2|nr:hypothetical protein [Nocardia carnea]